MNANLNNLDNKSEYDIYMDRYNSYVKAYSTAFREGNEFELSRLAKVLMEFGAEFVNGRWYLDEDAY